MKNKVKQSLSILCLIIFSVFALLINFPQANKEYVDLQAEMLALEQTMKKEAKLLANYNYAQNNYVINSKQDLIDFRNAVNSGTTHSGLTVKLGCYIDLSGEDWIPIGSMIGTSKKFFKGNFDGNGYVIDNVKICSDTTNVCGDIGLFGYVQGGTIKNLTVAVDSYTMTTAGKSMGGIVGSTSDTVKIDDCFVLPASTSSKLATNNTKTNTSINIGGIVGYCDGSCTITQCANYVTLNNRAYNQARCGGIVGCCPNTSKASLNKCYSSGSITCGSSSTTKSYCGGIVGLSQSKNVSILHCLNKARLYGYVKDSGSSDSALASESSLRDTDGIKISSISQASWNNDVYNDLVVGGIVGDGGGCTVSYCVNYTTKSNHSVYSDYYSDTIKYFYGYYGDTTDGVPCNTAWYGDYIEFTFKQYILNIKEIGSNVAATSNYSYDYGNYYSTSSSGTLYDRLYRVKITGADKNGVKASALSLSECISNPNKSIKYIRETSISSKPTIILPVYSTGNTIFVDDFKTNCCDDTYFYDSGNGMWLKGNVYNLYSTSYSAHQLGLSTVYISNYNDIAQVYGIYNSSWFSGNTILGSPLYAYGLDDDEQPHYQNLASKSITAGTAYTSYFNSRFVKSANDGCPNQYHEDKKSAIKTNKITITEGTDSYTIKHTYQYDTSYWAWFDNHWNSASSGSKTLCTATNRRSLVDAEKDYKNYFTKIPTKALDSDKTKMIDSLNTNSANTWLMDNDSPTLKWLKWKYNYDDPTN